MGAVRSWCERGEAALAPLFAALADRSLAADVELPSTGVPLERERQLSAVFIMGEAYGTRCSTVLAITRSGNATFVERSFAPDGSPTGEVVQCFELAAQRSERSIAT